MNRLVQVIALFCALLIVTTPFIYAEATRTSSGLATSDPNPYSTPSSQKADPYYGGNLGGYTYIDPTRDQIKTASGGYSYGNEVYLGEAINIYVADYQPKQVRQSALEQQDLLVYIYLKGLTVGTLLSPFTTDPEAKDPLSGITNIPPIDYIDVNYNSTSESSKYVRFARHMPPRADRFSLNNLGTVVVYLRKLANEEDLPEDNIITIDMNAKIFLKLQESNLLGISQQDLVLKEFPNEEQFLDNKNDYSFFSNKGYIRATRIGPDSVTLQVYNKDLYPLSLAPGSFTNPATSQGLRQTTQITLTRGKTSNPVSFRYTGNPLTDSFQIRLDDISTPSNKAELEFYLEGRKVSRKVSEGRELFLGSNWILKSISSSKSETINQDDINEMTEKFNLNAQAKNRVIQRLNQLGEGNLAVYKHQIVLENKFTRDTKVIEREILSETEGNKLDLSINPIPRDLAEFLEEKYCINENPLVEKEDFACEAIKKYKKLIRQYPTSPEAEKAKLDLGEIYDNELIGYKACIATAAGTAADESECRKFRMDMLDLANFYYSQIGEATRISKKYGGAGGKEFLEDEGVSLQLLRVITEEEEQSTINLRVYTDINNYNEENTKKQGDEVDLSVPVSYRGDESYVWRVSSIGSESATLRLFKKDEKLLGSGIKYKSTNIPQVTLKLNEPKPVTATFPELDEDKNPIEPETFTNVMLTKIDSKLEAYVTILPGTGRAYTTSNFRINIPIDPRPFKLTPEQMESHIATTKEIIDKINKVIDKLDTVISTMKKLCLGVWAFLTVKNSFSGARNIARKQVSESFKIKCQQESSEDPDKFPTIDRCLNHYSDEITASIDKTEDHIAEINSKIKGKTIDELKASGNLESIGEKEICGGFNEFAQASQSLGARNQDIIKQYRDCLLYAKIQTDNSLDQNFRNFASRNLDEIGTKNKVQIFDRAKQIADQDPYYDSNNEEHISKIINQLEIESQEEFEDLNLVDIDMTDPTEGIWTGRALVKDSTLPTGHKTRILRGVSKYDELINEEEGESEVKELICNKYLTAAEWADNRCVQEDNPNRLRDDEVTRRIDFLKKQPAQQGPYQKFVSADYYQDSGGLASKGSDAFNEAKCKASGGEWTGIVSKTCEPIFYTTQSIINTAGQQINKFYSEDPLPAYYDNDGLSYCYPVGDGDYALVQERFQGQNKGINKLEVYNIGSNGRIECGSNDDELVHNVNKLEVLTNLKQGYISKEPKIKCTSKEEDNSVGRKVDGKAVICKIGLQGNRLNQLTAPKCIDVMDPTDCKIMFNFCDPVMCPSSRCTLGGRVQERNVIQSGIVGSTLLCLPNIKEGVAVPVCLTGISAGLKNIRSILEGYVNCLEIKLSKGENVGFCDYIRSVGVCELIWKEAYNLLDIGGRGIIDWVSGSVFNEPEGGGEYLTFQSSLNNVGESVRVFTNEYKTTYTAQFLSQSTDEIGSQICRLSVNGKLPNVGQILDQLTEPENPPQFTAFFDETPYAAPGDALPSRNIPYGTQEISLYKTFYHIYAGTGFYQGSFTEPRSLFNPETGLGKPQPITYSVYLRNKQLGLPPLYVTFPGEASQYTGRLEQGKYAQESVQKPGTKGYNEICVVINGIENCGFGKIGTSFGLDELNDVLTGNEAEQEIDSAEECVPSSTRSKSYSIGKLGALAAAQAGSGMLTGVVTSDAERGLFSTGIIRVCSAAQPTPETGRWKEVGNCDEDERGKTLGSCWLDLNSVSIKDREIESDTYNELFSRAEEKIRPIDAENSRSILISLNQQRNDLLESIRSQVRQAKKGQTSTPAVAHQRPVVTIARLPSDGGVSLPPDAGEIQDSTTPNPDTGSPDSGTLDAGVLPSLTRPQVTPYSEVYISDTQLERELSPFILQKAEEYGLNYFFIKAIINTESDWRPTIISDCGAAGIIQLMPHTASDAIDRGAPMDPAVLLNTVDGIRYRGGCARSYGAALKSFANGLSQNELIGYDQRFDNEIAIETAMVYFVELIEPILSRSGIPLTVENMAAAYNAGPVAVENAGGVPAFAQSYATEVNEHYDNMINQAGAYVPSYPAIPEP